MLSVGGGSIGLLPITPAIGLNRSRVMAVVLLGLRGRRALYDKIEVWVDYPARLRSPDRIPRKAFVGRAGAALTIHGHGPPCLCFARSAPRTAPWALCLDLRVNEAAKGAEMWALEEA